MVFEFKFPDVGEGIHEGVLLKWLIKEGDSVKEDQPIAEVETDKAVVEIPSPKTATILKLHAKEGETIEVGNVIVSFGGEGETATATPVEDKATNQDKPEPTTSSSTDSVITKEEPVAKTAAPVTTVTGRVMATPATRRLARELGVDIHTVQGTGPGGRITDDDLKNASTGKAATASIQTTPASSEAVKHEFKHETVKTTGTVERIPLKGVRKAISDHMVKSAYTAPQVTHVDECDVTDLVTLRARQKEDAAKKGVKLTYLPFIVKALVASLKDHPYLNASIDETTQEIVLKKYYNIGIAVDTPDGLFVFVLKDADRKSILQLAKEIQEQAVKAKEHKLTREDMANGTFTITNIGSAGGLMATPILNYPEVGILGVYKIKEMPVVKDGKAVIRKIMNMSITFDHRCSDGAEAARFMNDVIKYLEDPGLMLVDVV